MILYIEAPCMACINIYLDIDLTLARISFDVSRWVLRKVPIEALLRRQHKVCSYFTYFVLQRLDILDGQRLTVEFICVQAVISFSIFEIIFCKTILNNLATATALFL